MKKKVVKSYNPTKMEYFTSVALKALIAKHKLDHNETVDDFQVKIVNGAIAYAEITINSLRKAGHDSE